MSDIERLLDYAIEQKASDVHITTNRESTLRINGGIIKSDVIISKDDLIQFCATQGDLMVDKITDFIHSRRFSIDCAITYNHRRFRVHIYKSINETCAVLRLLSEKVPDLFQLNLPPVVSKFVTLNSGLVLVCGATGSGKTTTIASIIDQINHIKDKVILTIEDPIEYVYTESKAVIEQREVGTHVESFSQATVDALREDPDIIVVGEMRDLETIKNAITLAETGHLVFGTLHTKSAIDAIDRIIDIFPPEQQQQIRVQLSSILTAIVHQQLVQSSNGKRVVLCEALIIDGVIAGTIKQPSKSSLNTLKDYMKIKDNPCISLIDNAMWHIKNGRLTLDNVKYNISEEDYRLLVARLK